MQLSANINYVGPPWSCLGVRNWSRLPLPASGGNQTSQFLKWQTLQESAPSPAAALGLGAQSQRQQCLHVEGGLSPRSPAGRPGRSDPPCPALGWQVFSLILRLLRSWLLYIPEFLNLGTINIWDLIVLRGGGCSVHYRIFNSMLVSTHQLPVTLLLQVVTTKNFCRICQMFPRMGLGHTQLRTTGRPSFYKKGNWSKKSCSVQGLLTKKWQSWIPTPGPTHFLCYFDHTAWLAES